MWAFLCSIDESVWDVVDIGWTRPEAAKSTWDKAALAIANANSKDLNAIFCGVSLDEFTGFLILQLPRRHGKFWIQLMREPRR